MASGAKSSSRREIEFTLDEFFGQTAPERRCRGDPRPRALNARSGGGSSSRSIASRLSVDAEKHLRPVAGARAR